MVHAPLSSLALHERTRREILHKSELIPSMPEVVTEVLRLAHDENADLGDFDRCLRNDTALVARLLKVVNSPFYGTNHKITSIRDGIGVIGTRSLKSLVLAAGTANYLQRSYACYGYENKGLWQHSLVVAAGSRALAGSVGLTLREKEELFVMGLLHDIGKLLLGPYLTELGEDVSRHPEPEVEVEAKLLGIDHTEAGALIAEKWNLSELVVKVIRNTHADGDDPGARREMAIVRLADYRARRLGYGYRADLGEGPWVHDADLEALGLDETSWNEACEKMTEAGEAALSSMGNLGS